MPSPTKLFCYYLVEPVCLRVLHAVRRPGGIITIFFFFLRACCAYLYNRNHFCRLVWCLFSLLFFCFFQGWWSSKCRRATITTSCNDIFQRLSCQLFFYIAYLSPFVVYV